MLLLEKFTEKDWTSYYASDQDFIGEQFPSEKLLTLGWFAKIRHLPPPRCRGDLRIVLSTPHKNDAAARLYPWVAPYWHGLQ